MRRLRSHSADSSARVAPTRFAPRDLVDEALAGILARPARAALTVLGTLLGIAAFVAVLGLTSTASGQISERFDALVATEVEIGVRAAEGAGESAVAVEPLPEDAENRLSEVNGVVSSGVYWSVGNRDVTDREPGAADRAERLEVVAASPGFFEAVRSDLRTGRVFDDFHEDNAERVVVLGRGAAARLGVDDARHAPAVFVDGVALTVIGIIEEADRHPEILMGAVVPAGTARDLWGEPGTNGTDTEGMVIDTQLGAAVQVGEEAPFALRPENPGSLQVTTPPDPRELRDDISTDLSGLFLALAVICLVIGAVGIANTTLVSVLERVPEIGLRRALGARRRHVAALFLTESTLLGLLGGLVGTAIGVGCVVAVAVAQNWTPVLEPLTVLPAPVVGALTGLVAGAYPAWRAARIEPAEALRR